MKTLICLLAVLPALGQNYAAYNGNPVARMSFLRSQYFDTAQSGASGAGGTFRDASMIAYWPFNIANTDVARDFSGHGVTGTFAAGQSWYFGPGKVSRYTTYWNDAGDFVQIPAITLTTPITISAWVWVKQAPSSHTRIVENNYLSGPYLGTDGGGLWQTIVNSTTTTGCAASTVTYGGAGNATSIGWQMVSMTYDGTSAYLYVNGVSVAGPCTYSTYGTLTGTTLRIGCYNTGSTCSSTNGALKGEIADVRIYSRVLTAAELLAIYNAENH